MENQTRRGERAQPEKWSGQGRRRPLRLIFLTFLVFSLAGGLSGEASGQGGKFPAPTGYINDLAGVIAPETTRQLEEQLTNFEQQTGTQVGVVTLPSLEGRSIEEVANELYRAWGIGAKTGPNKDKGALLILAINDRKTRLEVGYGLEGDLPDGLAGELIRRMRPFLQRKDYSMAVEVGVGSIVTTLSERWQIPVGASGGSGEVSRARPTRERSSPLTTLIVLFFFLIVFGLIIQSIGKGLKGQSVRKRGSGDNALFWLFPTILDLILTIVKIFLLSGSSGGGSRRDSGSDWGGGGWGGGGGGGWGGFGGGSSGGGGASDSW
ncbi:MAG: TPM domain-containing protein [Blastocatellia bacterium]|jgi:uncharacterized protein